MTKKEFMKKEKVKLERTVDKWIQKNLIPGVNPIEMTGELYFPPSARRPYFPPWNLRKDQDAISSAWKQCTTAQRKKYVLQALKTVNDVVSIAANVFAVCGVLS